MKYSNELSNKVTEPKVINIRPPQGWTPIDFVELWQHRNLLLYLVLRDIRIVFAGTRLGVLWVVLPPLATATVMTVMLGFLAKIPSHELPYALIVLSGMVPWLYFNNVVSKATYSMSANAYLLTKVYFPRLIIPIVPMLAGLVDLFALLAVLLLALLLFGVMPQASWFFVIVSMSLTIFLTIGASLWLSALNVKYSDIGKLLPILLQLMAYASPIFYPHSFIPAKWYWLYDLNPFVGIVESMRWALFGITAFPNYSFSISVLFASVITLSGIFFFRSVEDTAADII